MSSSASSPSAGARSERADREGAAGPGADREVAQRRLEHVVTRVAGHVDATAEGAPAHRRSPDPAGQPLPSFLLDHQDPWLQTHETTRMSRSDSQRRSRGPLIRSRLSDRARRPVPPLVMAARSGVRGRYPDLGVVDVRVQISKTDTFRCWPARRRRSPGSCVATMPPPKRTAVATTRASMTNSLPAPASARRWPAIRAIRAPVVTTRAKPRPSSASTGSSEPCPRYNSTSTAEGIRTGAFR